MKYFEVFLIGFGVLLMEFGYLNCSDHRTDNSQFFRKEVDDFQEWLREKVAKEPSVDRKASVDVSVSEDASDYFNDDEYKNHKDSQDFQSLLEKLSHDPNVLEVQTPILEHEISSEKTVTSQADKKNSKEIPKQHFPVEEFLLYRRSDSETNDPIPEIVEKLVHDLPSRKVESEIDHKVAAPHESVTIDPNVPLTDFCSAHNLSSNMHDVCRVGPEYEIRFHPEYSKILERDMENMLTKSENPNASKCDYRKLHGPKSGVEDRALCPFEWIISDSNPSRIPEYLFEAKCSCQLSREIDGENLECVPIKRPVPVLWTTECQDGKKKQKLGWEEIAVACAPLKVRESDVIELNSME